VTWTALQPDVYMDVWVPIWVLGPVAAGQPVRLVGEASRKHYFTYSHDVARFAVGALVGAEARDATILLGGPEPLSWTDVVATVGKVRGEPVETLRIPADRPVEGVPDMLSGLLLGMETYDSPPPVDPERARTAYGVTLTSLEDYLRAAAS
jgi:NADH dehydrogenase